MTVLSEGDADSAPRTKRRTWRVERGMLVGEIHYDANMSDAFFRDSACRSPHFHLSAAARMPSRRAGV